MSALLHRMCHDIRRCVVLLISHMLLDKNCLESFFCISYIYIFYECKYYDIVM